jgi:hypothetical protein
MKLSTEIKKQIKKIREEVEIIEHCPCMCDRRVLKSLLPKIEKLEEESHKFKKQHYIDDILLQEIYSLKEKLKFAIYHLHNFDPTFDINDYTHRLNSVDFDQWIEEYINQLEE